ncbi:MAG: UDP-N-acetylglucosamine transferase subunit [Claussenomyces sp. TS43310]|nr:MAG: UDP-N-acetylglucosamine transferase subunit [Claussenomyces sp. TS43310]
MVAQVSALPLGLSFCIILLLAVFARLLRILPSLAEALPTGRSARTRPSHICIVLGSGGHTAEMLSMIRDLNPRRYTKRTYLVSSGDSFSAGKAADFELMLTSKERLESNSPKDGGSSKTETLDASRLGGTFAIITVPRARRIHQPLCSTPFTSLQCLWACIKTLARDDADPLARPGCDGNVPAHATRDKHGTPDIVLTNGPATGVIVVLAVLILKFFGMQGTGEMKTIYVESWARVKTLSLSGRILKLGLTDRFLVQWEALKEGRAEYRGVLVE